MRASDLLLWLRAALFTVLVPGTVTTVLPWLVSDGAFPVGELRGGAARVVGALLLAIGAAIYFRCLWDFVTRGRGIPAPIDHPKRLVVRGLYRYVRNPMYLGVLLVLIGEAVLFRAPALLSYIAIWLLVVHLFVLLYEEPNLRRRFGADYLRYRARVRRWIPGRPYRESD